MKVTLRKSWRRQPNLIETTNSSEYYSCKFQKRTSPAKQVMNNKTWRLPNYKTHLDDSGWRLLTQVVPQTPQPLSPRPSRQSLLTWVVRTISSHLGVIRMTPFHPGCLEDPLSSGLSGRPSLTWVIWTTRVERLLFTRMRDCCPDKPSERGGHPDDRVIQTTQLRSHPESAKRVLFGLF